MIHYSESEYENYNEMKTLIIGAGVVGPATDIGLHRYGHHIVFYYADEQRLEILAKQGYRVAKALRLSAALMST